MQNGLSLQDYNVFVCVCQNLHWLETIGLKQVDKKLFCEILTLSI